MWIDSHSHINFPQLYPQTEKIISRAEKESFYALIDCGVNLETSLKSLKISAQYAFVYSIIGFHPSYAKDFTPQIIEEYKKLIKENKKIIGIGEVGLDNKTAVPVETQEKILLEMLNLAQSQNLPVIIHNRGYGDRILNIIKNFKLKSVLFHCFSQNKEFARKIADKGFFMSFAGNITYPKADNIRQAAKYAPWENILAETDSPYLAPQAIRGKINTPLYVQEIYKTLAQEKNIDIEKVKIKIKENFQKLFFTP